jgi:hypothetical protein
VEAGLLAVAAAATQIAEVPVEVDVASAETGEGIKGGVPADKGGVATRSPGNAAAVRAAIDAAPGTARVVGVRDDPENVTLTGYTGHVTVEA